MILVLPTSLHMQGAVSFTVVDHAFEVHCAASNQPTVAVIYWTSGVEQNVFTYKIHRTATNGAEDNRWVNRFPLTATGPGSGYRIIDSAAMPNTTYRYRLYGFDESGRLSLANWVMLDETMQPSCRYFPIAGYD